MKNNDGKIITIFLNMHFDVHHYPVKFKIKIQHVFGEIKKINYIKG